MKLILLIVLILSGIVFVGSVLMMSPKGGLGMGIGGMAGGGQDYGSKKTIESKLKKVAVVTAIIFVLIALILPFVK